MLKTTLLALALLLSSGISYASDKKSGISISFSSEDPRTHLGGRRNVRDARMAITSRDGSVSLMLMNDVVAVQLTDRVLEKAKTDEDANLLEEIIASGVRLAIGKAVEYPIAAIRSAEIRDGVLVLTNDKGKPVFTEVKVNGTEVFRDFAIGDAARFVNAFRAAKSLMGSR
jgi:hypothetical protein